MKCSISLDTPSNQTEVLTLSHHHCMSWWPGEFWWVTLIRLVGIRLPISFIILFQISIYKVLEYKASLNKNKLKLKIFVMCESLLTSLHFIFITIHAYAYTCTTVIDNKVWWQCLNCVAGTWCAKVKPTSANLKEPLLLQYCLIKIHHNQKQFNIIYIIIQVLTKLHPKTTSVISGLLCAHVVMMSLLLCQALLIIYFCSVQPP